MLLKMHLTEVISVHSNHSNIQNIKSLCNTDSKFDLPKQTASDSNKLIKYLDTSKVTRPWYIC